MSIYHEKQIGGLCASHCMNNLLQDAVFDEIELSEIGLEMDRRERDAGLGGIESQNVRADGFFSVQVGVASYLSFRAADVLRELAVLLVRRVHFRGGE